MFLPMLFLQRNNILYSSFNKIKSSFQKPQNIEFNTVGFEYKFLGRMCDGSFTVQSILLQSS